MPPPSETSLWQRPATRSLLLSANFFLIILAYYQVKPASRSLFLVQAHAADLPYLWAGSAAVLLALMPVYQGMVRRYSRLSIVIGTCVVTVVLLIVFRVLMLRAGLATAVGFYIFADIFSVVLVEQLWSVTNSVCDSAESRRGYGVVASGGLLGGLAGGIFAAWLLAATPLASEDLLLVAAGILMLMIGLTLRFARHGLYRESTRRVRLDATVAVAEGLRTLRHNRYLALVAVMLLLSQMAEPIVEYQFMSMVERAYPGADDRTAYLSNFLSLLSGVALLINLFVTPLVHRKLGAIAGLLMQPFLLGLSALGFTFQYWLGMAAGMKIADRGLSYSINRTSRELLYVPVDPVTIFRVKAWIDMVGYRVFKIAGIGAILLLTQWLPWKLSVAHLSWAVIALCGAWIWAALGIRGDYQTLEDAAALANDDAAVVAGRNAVQPGRLARVAGVAGVLVLCVLAGGARADPLPETASRQGAIEAMKSAPRGPFKHIRHYCADGSVLPPKETCDSHGGGQVEHGEWTDEVVGLRQGGYEIANIYAIVKPERFTGPSADLKALRQMLVERYLIGIDDGWVMRVTRSYRGSIQAEDEGLGAARLVGALLDDPLWRDDARYFLLRETIRLLPGSPDAGERAPSAADVRDRAIKLSEEDPAFQSIRIKIHNVPNSEDAVAVRAFAKRHAKPERAAAYEELAALIATLYVQSPAPERMRAVARTIPGTPLAAELELGAGTLEAAKAPEARFLEASRWLVRLRREARGLRERASALALFEASIALEETAYASGNLLLKAAEGATRRQRLEWIAQSADALAGSGLLNLRHADGIRASVARLLAADPSSASYREEVRYLARPPEWAAATFRFHLQEGADSLAELDPLAQRYSQDRLRGSPLLFYASLADGLVKDANSEAGITHEVFGKTRGTGLRALNPGLARGTIRVPSDPAKIETFDPRGIYLLPHTIAELPPVAGILTEGEGSSLSHVQLLARNLGIPNVVVGPEVVDAIRSRNGKKAVLAVSPSGIVQLEADGERWNAVFGKQQADPGVRIKPDLLKLDLVTKDFFGLENVRASDAGRIVGPKSANLGELQHTFGAQVPDGVVIPFGAFKQLLDQPIEPGKPTVFAWVQKEYRSIDKLPESAAKQKAVKSLLARMRKWTETVDPGDAFRTEIRGALARLSPNGGGVFVRSDTNVEDLAGFTGAGLNRTVANVVGEEAVMKAIREVWASPFADRSYAWRQSLMDEPELVFPAVLLQTSFPSEKSGVMVATDVEGGRDGFLSIATNEGVSGAVDGQAAESLLVSSDGKDVRYLSQATAPLRNGLAPAGGIVSAPTSGSDTVLQPGELAQLVLLAREAPQRFPLLRGDDGTPRPADVEFGFAGGKLALLQIRPFNESKRARQSIYLRSLDARIAGDSARKVALDAVPKGPSS